MWRKTVQTCGFLCGKPRILVVETLQLPLAHSVVANFQSFQKSDDQAVVLFGHADPTNGQLRNLG